ncbi:MAG: adenosylmethionine--8-amino-7-oxononanoate transaminase [Hamadaea sp.]|nr:adenosylmethionine--8-amino-7-oxononanoate transaminase [Hamadaea sp.]
MNADELLRLDREHVWHPYGPPPGQLAAASAARTEPGGMKRPGRMEPLVVRSASGVRLTLDDGRELVDGMSSWWAAIHGYRHPVLDAALTEQAGRMSHVMFGGLTHEPAVRLAQTLVEITPAGLEHVFLADSGSVSVEVGIKMALQYWRSLGRPAKRRLLTWRGGYHGDTFHPMSVCDPDGGMHSLWGDVLPRQVFAGVPPLSYEQSYVDELTAALTENADEVAAIIVEPLVQGAGGMRWHHPAYLRVLRELADEFGVLLIFDEIATGFGRTGRMFAADHAGVTPDIMCVGKALTGGYLTLAAALCTPAVAEGISRGDVPVLAHGPTFMGNPLACAVANASLDLLLASDWPGRVAHIAERLEAGLADAADLPGVRDVRVLGAIGVIQLDHEVALGPATAAAVNHGVWLRPFRDLIYTMPPYVTSDADLALVTGAMRAAATASRSASSQHSS